MGLGSTAGRWGCLFCVLVLGCGGQLEGEGGQGHEQDGSPTGGGEASEPDEPAPGDLTLGECELGVPAYEAGHECNWLAEDLCYLTKPAACACICPRDGPSSCISDFYGGEGSRTKVTCR